MTEICWLALAAMTAYCEAARYMPLPFDAVVGMKSIQQLLVAHSRTARVNPERMAEAEAVAVMLAFRPPPAAILMISR